ncbi:MAG: archaeosortase/exosortase family protein [bacterium]|nr:MAG: archaeosortase/exosortase family protein [bacterium]
MKYKRSKRGRYQPSRTKRRDESIGLFGRLVERVIKNKDAVTFFVLFLLLVSVFFIAYVLARSHAPGVGIAINTFTAKAVVFTCRILGLNVRRDWFDIEMGGGSFRIVFECTGFFVAFLFLSCVLAFPANLKKKGIGLAIGLPVIFIVNIFRVITIMLVDIWKPQYTHAVHMYLWNISFIIIVVVLFQIWVDGVVKKAADKLLLLVKFVAYSIVIFAFMSIVVSAPYQRLLYRIVCFLFRKEPYRSEAHDLIVIGRIFNIVTYVSLMLSTSKVPWLKRLKFTGIGLLIIFACHVILSVSANFDAFHDLSGRFRTVVDSITLIAHFVLPLLLWFLFTYTYTFKPLGTVKNQILPGTKQQPIRTQD